MQDHNIQRKIKARVEQQELTPTRIIERHYDNKEKIGIKEEVQYDLVTEQVKSTRMPRPNELLSLRALVFARTRLVLKDLLPF
jgi:hypothetical protein